MEASKRIDEILSDNQIQLSQLADLLDVSVQTLSNIRTRNSISVRIAKQISTKLNYSFRWLREGKEPKFKSQINPDMLKVERTQSHEVNDPLTKRIEDLERDVEFMKAIVTELLHYQRLKEKESKIA